MTKSLPTASELQEAWNELREIYETYLLPYEVKIPKAEHYSEIARSIWLAVLFHFEGEEVHKDVISDVCQRDKPELARDQQVRHLKREGWHLTGKRGFHCLDPYQPSPEWVTERNRRAGRLGAKDFSGLKKFFGNACATCGAKEGRPDPRYGQDIVALQHGHIDPAKPANDKDNIIPQCQFCNRAYRSDFVFDDKGRVYAVADVGPVRRASRPIQKKILEWLKSVFS
ncbi:MAG: hypothetical protein OXG23_00480 [Chloroflexi bacterium]|nr:hypothetical protein [Chloroflexota bacterium]MCY3976548.1 hypothetical protein [Chloroflexota bacterium]